jgi:hypothetical protein
MARAASVPVKKQPAVIPVSSRARAGNAAPASPPKNSRAPVQILTSTKEWLDQIIAERMLRSYDEAIMFLITERQQHLASDFGVYSDLEDYVCTGED